MSEHPEAMVALAYFDMALFEPTIACLGAIEDRLMPGSLVVFDEFGHPDYPGEARAYREALMNRPHRIARSQILPDRTIVTITG